MGSFSAIQCKYRSVMVIIYSCRFIDSEKKNLTTKKKIRILLQTNFGMYLLKKSILGLDLLFHCNHLRVPYQKSFGK